MSYRNHIEAENFRLKQELEEREARIKELSEKLEDNENSLDKLEEKLLKKSPVRKALDKFYQRQEERKAEQARESYWKARQSGQRNFFRKRRHMSDFDRSFRRVGIIHSIVMFGIFAFWALIVGSCVYQYFTDINQGTVIGRDHEDSYWAYDSDGDYTYYPETWSITITDQGETATWGVSEWDYNHFQDGDEYCYEDFFHECK